MKYSVVLHGKPILIELSNRAQKTLNRREEPLYVDIHLIFGCMVAKRVWFTDQLDGDVVSASTLLKVSFRAVKYDVCSFENIDNGGTPEDFPLKKEMKKFIPNYLFIDYKKNKYTGEYTYDNKLHVPN